MKKVSDLLLAKDSASSILEYMRSTLYILLSACLTTCACGDSLRIKDRWEGIESGRIRVYVRDIPDEESERYEGEFSPSLQDLSRDRARLILNNYILLSLGEKETLSSDHLKVLVSECLKNGKTVLTDEESDYSAVLTDYDISSLQNEISRLKAMQNENKGDRK